MIFDYPRPLKVGARTWKRVDSFYILGQGTQVMYSRDPAGLGNTPYDHISIVVGNGPDLRPLNNEFHVTVKAAVPFAIPAPTVVIGGIAYPQANLVFYWDFDVQYSPASVALSTKGTLNAGRVVKIIDGALGSKAVPGGGQVSGNAAVARLRTDTAGVRGPMQYARDFWEDLIAAQPVTVQMSSNDPNDSLMLEYEVIRPGLSSLSGTFDAAGQVVVTAAMAGMQPSLCSVLVKGHARDAISLNAKGSRFMLFGGRYVCSISSIS
jgi:hypothetical protein